MSQYNIGNIYFAQKKFKDAIKKFKQNNYSLDITDLTMPKRSGLELLKEIKSIAPTKPEIMATA